MELLDLFTKTYDINKYECSRFAVDAYRYFLKSDELADDLACFFNLKQASIDIKNKFRIVKEISDIQLGDLVVLHNSLGHTHVAVALNSYEFIHISPSGVSTVGWKLLHTGFNRSKVYRHVSKC